MADKNNLIIAGYVLGIISIVGAFFSPLQAFIIGVIGFNISKKQKGDLAKKAIKYNKIGMIISAILFIISIAVYAYFLMQGINSSNFLTP